MMGRTHAATAIAAWTAGCAAASTAGWPPPTAAVIAGTVIAAVAAYVPDIDHENSRAAKSLGIATRTISKVISAVAGHRGATHSLAATAVVSAAAWSASWAAASAVGATSSASTVAAWTASATATGYLTAILGDATTIQGIPLWLPVTHRRVWVLPRPLRLRTGSATEHLVVYATAHAISIAAVCVIAGAPPPVTAVAVAVAAVAAAVVGRQHLRRSSS